MGETPAGAVITFAAERAAAARRRSEATIESELGAESGEAKEDGNCAVM